MYTNLLMRLVSLYSLGKVLLTEVLKRRLWFWENLTVWPVLVAVLWLANCWAFFCILMGFVTSVYHHAHWLAKNDLACLVEALAHGLIINLHRKAKRHNKKTYMYLTLNIQSWQENLKPWPHCNTARSWS